MLSTVAHPGTTPYFQLYNNDPSVCYPGLLHFWGVGERIAGCWNLETPGGGEGGVELRLQYGYFAHSININ